MKRISSVAAYLNENAEKLANEIVHNIVQRFEFEVPKQEIDAAIIVYTDFISLLGEAIIFEKDDAPEGLIEWSKTNGERTAAQGEKVSIIIARYPHTRLVFIEKLTNISIEFGLPAEEVVFINKRFNYMLDISIKETVLAFERVTDEIIKEARSEILGLSAPVVPLQDGLAVLPLIGTINEERAKYLVEATIPKIAEWQLEYLIIDFSGILHIDDMVEKHLFEIHRILKLLGIKAIATGIRPDLAQKFVSIGVDLSSIETYATVKQAMERMK
ncbi:STAS domain-containing protein [Bacillus aerolatus]|uniref:STAS domain-containing protein n=1 Tax=Bacillus aerolatus TaxID=2653354 RepID=A0A6I1FGE9_9BACI|nr:STAS domain-containing protein [Bacillus aerolatus]